MTFRDMSALSDSVVFSLKYAVFSIVSMRIIHCGRLVYYHVQQKAYKQEVCGLDINRWQWLK
jgi:hypothetical protein